MNTVFLGESGKFSPEVAYGMLLGTPLHEEFEGEMYGPGATLGELAIQTHAAGGELVIDDAPVLVRFCNQIGSASSCEGTINASEIAGISLARDFRRIDISKLSNRGMNWVNGLTEASLFLSPNGVALNLNDMTGTFGHTKTIRLDSEGSNGKGRPFDEFRNEIRVRVVSLMDYCTGWEFEDGLWIPPEEFTN